MYVSYYYIVYFCRSICQTLVVLFYSFDAIIDLLLVLYLIGTQSDTGALLINMITGHLLHGANIWLLVTIGGNL